MRNKMKTYNVLSPVRTEAGIVKDGTLQLSDADAQELLEIGAVELAATQPAAAPVEPTDPAERQAAIIEAIKQLDPNDADLWLKDGKPDTNAIAEVTGWAVTAGERNTAWTTINAGK